MTPSRTTLTAIALAAALAAAGAPAAVAGTPSGGGAIAPTGATGVSAGSGGATGATGARSGATSKTGAPGTGATSKSGAAKPFSHGKPAARKRPSRPARPPVLLSVRCYQVRNTVCGTNPHIVQATGELVVRGHFLTPGYWVYFPRAGATSARAAALRALLRPTLHGLAVTIPPGAGSGRI